MQTRLSFLRRACGPLRSSCDIGGIQTRRHPSAPVLTDAVSVAVKPGPIRGPMNIRPVGFNASRKAPQRPRNMPIPLVETRPVSMKAPPRLTSAPTRSATHPKPTTVHPTRRGRLQAIAGRLERPSPAGSIGSLLAHTPPVHRRGATPNGNADAPGRSRVFCPHPRLPMSAACRVIP